MIVLALVLAPALVLVPVPVPVALVLSDAARAASIPALRAVVLSRVKG